MLRLPLRLADRANRRRRVHSEPFSLTCSLHLDVALALWKDGTLPIPPSSVDFFCRLRVLPPHGDGISDFVVLVRLDPWLPSRDQCIWTNYAVLCSACGCVLDRDVCGDAQCELRFERFHSIGSISDVRLVPLQEESSFRLDYIRCWLEGMILSNDQIVCIPRRGNGELQPDRILSYRVLLSHQEESGFVVSSTRLKLDLGLGSQHEDVCPFEGPMQGSFVESVHRGLVGSIRRMLLSRPGGRKSRSLLVLANPGSCAFEIVEHICVCLLRLPQVIRLFPADVHSGLGFGENETLRTLFLRVCRKKCVFGDGPVIVLIPELDCLFPSNPGDRDVDLVGELAGFLQNERVATIGVCTSSQRFDPLVSRMFEDRVEMSDCLPSEKLQIFSEAASFDSDSVTRDFLRAAAARANRLARTDVLLLLKRWNARDSRMSVEFPSFVEEYRPTSVSPFSFELVDVPRVEWDDVVGLSKPKQVLQEMTAWPLQHADDFRRLGVRPVSGVLLFGPPGTGKTMLAKAVATSANCCFLSVHVPDLVRAEIGESEKNIAALFRKAKLSAPCVLFFDEIQALFGRREDIAKTERKLVAQFLLELDSMRPFDTSESSLSTVMIIAASNVPQALDSSLFRSGRLERVIHVGLPDPETRLALFRSYLRKVPSDPFDPEIFEGLPELSSNLDGYSGADVVSVCRRASLIALQRHFTEEVQDESEIRVTMADFKFASEVVHRSVSPELARVIREWKP